MNKIILFSSILALSAIVYLGCQKEVAKDNSSNSVIEEFRSAPPPPAVSPGLSVVSGTGDMACVGEEVTVTWGVTASCGSIRLEVWDASSGTAGAWVPAPGAAGNWQCPSTGKTYTFTANISQLGGCSGTPIASGKGYLFKVQYNPGNSSGCGCQGAPFGGGEFSTPICIGVEQCNVCTAWQYETAYGGETTGGGASWWYVFDISGSSTQTIWAGQTINAGTITYNSGTKVFTINLANGWELDPATTEGVKIWGLSSASGGRPIPGLANVYKGNSLTVDVSGSPYAFYAVHLDVRKCTTWE